MWFAIRVGSLLLGVATDIWIVSIALVMLSFAVVIYQIPTRAMRQRAAADRLLGRVVAAFRSFGLGGPVIGAPVGGLIS